MRGPLAVLHAAVLASVLVSTAVGEPAGDPYSCGWRKAAYDYGHQLQPLRPVGYFRDLFTALELGSLCNVTESPDEVYRRASRAVPSSEAGFGEHARAILRAAATKVYVDAVRGSDSNPGTLAAPVQTAGRGLALSRQARARPVAVVLREGLYRLEATLELTGQDNGTSLVAFPDEQPVLSGARLLEVQGEWSQHRVAPGGNRTTDIFNGTNCVYGATPSPTGPVYNYTRTPDAAACSAVCKAFKGPGSGLPCTAFTWHDSTWPLEYKDTCWIRTDGEWAPVPDADHVAGHVVTQPAINAWKATVKATGGALNATQRVRALVLNSTSRGIRARYPNADPETTRFPEGWIPRSKSWSWQSVAADLQSTDVTTLDMTKHGGYPTGMFSQYWMGAGGPCERFTNNASYWCQPNGRVAGQTFFVNTPTGITYKPGVLPNAPWPSGSDEGIVNWWRGGHWFTLMAGLNASAEGTLGLVGGATQGAEGDRDPAEFFVEQLLDELDSALEFHLDVSADGGSATLYYMPPLSVPVGTPPPAASVFEAPTLSRLVSVRGEPGAPATGISIVGLRMENTAPTYLGGPGWASCTGGDWGIAMDATVFLEHTEDVAVVEVDQSRIDGNGVMLLGHNHRTNITRATFDSIGGTAVALFGRSDGYDASNGDQPRFTTVDQMWCSRVGVFEKQSSCYYQGLAPQNTLSRSVMYESSRALINFEDSIGGGSVVDANLVFKSCLESQDHGPFNSWHRLPMLTRVADGSTLSAASAYTNMTRNFIVATEGGGLGPEAGANGGCFDLDDGSAWYRISNNWCSYGGYKTDFNGYSHRAVGNLDAYANVYGARCVDMSSLPVAADGMYDSEFSNSTCVLQSAGEAYMDIGGSCNPTDPSTFTLRLGGNTIYAPDASATVSCGGKKYTMEEWLATGIDPGTVVKPLPTPEEVVSMGRALLQIPTTAWKD